MRAVIALGVLCVANLLAFSPLLGSDMEFLTWDDTSNIVEQSTVNVWSLENLLSAWKTGSVSLGVYEPLGVTLKLLTAKLFGMHVRPFHLATLAIHIANAWLIYGIALQLIRRCDDALLSRLRPEYAALTASLLFSLNPMRVEVVAWASGQSYALAAFFLLISLAAYVRYCGQRADAIGRPATALAISAVAYGAAVLSKSSAIFLPPVLLLIDYYPFRRKLGLRLLFEKIPYGLIGVALFAVVWTTTADRQGIMSFELDPAARIAYAVHSLPFHLGKSLWPAEVHPSYGVTNPDVTPFSGSLLLYSAIATALCALAWAVRRRTPWFTVAWGFFVLGIVPVSGLFAHGNWLIGADRYAYMPVIGIWIVLGAAATSEWSMPVLDLRNARTRLTLAGLVLVIATWGVTTRRVVEYWSTTDSLWRHTLEIEPANAIALNNLGYFYMSRERYEESLPLFASAIRVDPGNLKPVLNLGVSLYRINRVEEAIYVYRNALTHHPRSVGLQNNMGVAYRKLGRNDLADQHYRRSNELKAQRSGG
jgi:tetratricopeptide (TPR) repeat protein